MLLRLEAPLAIPALTFLPQGTGEEVRVDYQLVDNVFSQASRRWPAALTTAA